MFMTKEILKGIEILEDIESGFGLSDYDTVMNQLNKQTRDKNFGSNEQVLVVQENNFISSKEFFEDNNYNDGENLSYDDIVEMLQEFDFEYVIDNTYNYSGYLSNDMNFIKLVNTVTEECIMLFAIHIGLDIRGGYTPYFAIKFDTEYEVFEMLGNRFEKCYATVMIDGVECFVTVDVEAVNDTASIYISNTDNICVYDEIYEWIDLSDNDSMLESLKEILLDNDIPIEKETLKLA